MTSRETLMKDPNSMLARLVSDSELISDKDDAGAYLIDRDGKYFSPVLNYLRHGKLILDTGLSAEGVLEEAEFYNITHLIALVKEHIQRRDQQTSVIDNKQRVYRVLQCQENELTHVSVISTFIYFSLLAKTYFNVNLYSYILDGITNVRRLEIRATH